MLLTDQIEIHQSQLLVWPSDILYVMIAGCDWRISIRSVNNMYDWRKFWKRFCYSFVFESRISTKTVVTGLGNYESTIIWESDMRANICVTLNIASRVIWELPSNVFMLMITPQSAVYNKHYTIWLATTQIKQFIKTTGDLVKSPTEGEEDFNTWQY